MDKTQKIHFLYWCRLPKSLSGQFYHTEDFIRVISGLNVVDKITVFGNARELNKLENISKVCVCLATEPRVFSHVVFLIKQIFTFFRMLRLRRVNPGTIFYFRYDPFTFLPVLLKACRIPNVYIEINGIPNQVMLEKKSSPHIKYSFLRRYFLFPLDKFMFRSADGIFTVCEVFKKNLIQNYGVKKDIYVIPNGYFSEDVSTLSREDAKLHLGLDLNAKYIIYSGNLVFYEGLEFLVASFVHLCQTSEHEKRILLILGKGPLEKRLHEMIPEHLKDRIQFLGFKPKDAMFQYIAAAHVCAYTPLTITYGIDGQRGGSPLKIVDYLSAGRPILVPRSQYYDYVERNQIGICYEPESKDSFVEKLIMLSSDEQKNQQLGDNARAYAKANLDWHQTLKPLFSMLEERDT